MSRSDIMAFRVWLRRQRKRQDAVGDFARDFLADSCANAVRTLSGLDRHMQDEHNAIDAALDARDQAWREYARECRPELVYASWREVAP